MLSTGKRSVEVALLSINGTPSHSPYSVSDLIKFLDISCLAVSFGLQVDDKASLGLVRPQTAQALAFTAETPPYLCQILELSQVSTPLCYSFGEVRETLESDYRSMNVQPLGLSLLGPSGQINLILSEYPRGDKHNQWIK